MSSQYLNAIVHLWDPVSKTDSFKKFKVIKNEQSKLEKFERFVRRSFPYADYVNYYWRHVPPPNFAFRRYLVPLV